MPSAYASEAEIANLALGHLGKPFISNINGSSVEASKSRFHLPMARRMALMHSDWSFARRTVALAALPVNVYEGRWSYAYDAPNGALKIYGVSKPQEPDRWIKDLYLEDGKIYCNIPEARCKYTRDVIDPAFWSDIFADAVALKLAEKMAPTMTRRRGDTTAMNALFMQTIAMAAEFDAAQQHQTYTEDNGYVDARGGLTRELPQRDGSTIWDN